MQQPQQPAQRMPTGPPLRPGPPQMGPPSGPMPFRPAKIPGGSIGTPPSLANLKCPPAQGTPGIPNPILTNGMQGPPAGPPPRLPGLPARPPGPPLRPPAPSMSPNLKFNGPQQPFVNGPPMPPQSVGNRPSGPPPLVNGHMRPTPPSSLPGSLSNQSSRQSSPIPTPQLDGMEQQVTPRSRLTPNSSLNGISSRPSSAGPAPSHSPQPVSSDTGLALGVQTTGSSQILENIGPRPPGSNQPNTVPSHLNGHFQGPAANAKPLKESTSGSQLSHIKPAPLSVPSSTGPATSGPSLVRPQFGPSITGPPVTRPPVSGPPLLGAQQIRPAGGFQPGPPVSGPPLAGPPVSGPPLGGPPISGPPLGGPLVSGPPLGSPPTGGPPLGGPPVSGPPLGGPPVSGPPLGGPPVSGPPLGGPPVSGPPLGGPPVSGPPLGGPPVSGPPLADLPVSGPPLGGPPVSGPPLGGPPVSGPPLGGPPVSGPPLGGPPVSGPPLGGPPVSVPSLGGPPCSGPSPVAHPSFPPVSGPPISGPPVSGPPLSGPTFSGPPVSGPPVSGPPVSGPPLSGPPVSGPPLSGPPVSGPPLSGLPFSGPPINGPPLGGLPVGGTTLNRPQASRPHAAGGPAAWTTMDNGPSMTQHSSMPPPPTSVPAPQPPNSGAGPYQHQPMGINSVAQQLGGLSVTRDGWNRGWGIHQYDLLQTKTVVPPQGVQPPKPILAQEYLPNCSPDIFRCTLTKIPETKNVLQKSRLPFGVLIHPFKDLEHLPVVSCSTIVRCRACRTYINPFVVFKGERRWECNLCYRVNELPEEFQYDPVSRTYGDPSRRPEVREATIEFIAPQEYMLRPPQPATYLWVLDVSRQAIDTGYLKVLCDSLLTQLDKIPGDRRTMIGFITYSSAVQFYIMGEGQKNVQLLEVCEIDDMFVPSPEDLLVNLDECRNLVEDLLTSLPQAHASVQHTQSALGAALQAAYKLMGPIGGRISVVTVTLPSIGPGALKPREDPNQRAGKEIQHLGPATDFYKKLALDCSGQQVAVDLFVLNSQYVDLATLSGVSKFSGGCIYQFPGFHAARNPSCIANFQSCLHRYITRKIGFEAVMRIRCTRGLSITNFHGNFFVRSTDLLSLPNINPDAGFAMQVNIEDSLTNIRTACFQAALLYTSSRGERRIRVHTICLPVTANMHEIITSADQEAVIGLLSKMAVDRCLTSSMSDARDALVNAVVDTLSAFKISLSTPKPGALEVPNTLQLLPLYVLALLKYVAFRSGLSTKLDDRVFAMCQLKYLPLSQLMNSVYPDMYAIHELSDKGALNYDDHVIPQPGRLHLSAERLERRGAYLMDAGDSIYIYVRSGIDPCWIENTLGLPSYAAIPQPLMDGGLPQLDTPQSELLRNFISHIQKVKPYPAPVHILREDNPMRILFIQHLVDDRSEGAHSYIEYLQYIKAQIK